MLLRVRLSRTNRALSVALSVTSRIRHGGTPRKESVEAIFQGFYCDAGNTVRGTNDKVRIVIIGLFEVL